MPGENFLSVMHGPYNHFIAATEKKVLRQSYPADSLTADFSALW
jgi:hypothetical protein